MDRSSAEQAAHNRARIGSDAKRLFREYGAEAISISQIMAATGMANGGLYKHFECKDVLVREACALPFNQVSSSWLAVSPSRNDDPDSKIEAIVHHYFRTRPAEQACPMPRVFAAGINGAMQ